MKQNNARSEKVKGLFETIQNFNNSIDGLTSEQYKDFLNKVCNFRNYSPNNQILIMVQNAIIRNDNGEIIQQNKTSQVASFKAWQELNRVVKKGSKSISILCPIICKKKEDEGGEDEKILIGFSYGSVFDISQTELIEGKEDKATQKEMTTASSKTFTEVYNFVKEKIKTIDGVNINIVNEKMEIARGGYYCRDSNLIALNSNLSELENIGTLVHEFCHCILGHGKDEDETTRRQREAEAETLTFLLCKDFGIQRKSEFYLKGWGKVNNINKIIKKYKEIIN